MYLYIHIPFCESKCKYCKFASFSLQKKEIDKYIEFLCQKEIPDTSLEDKKLDSIYLGGGSPGILGEDSLDRLFDTIKSKYILKKDIEITIETTPNLVTKQKIKSWENIGINRVSMGIQSTDDKTLKEIGRGTRDEIYKALDILKESNIKNISIDYIVGLPYEKLGDKKKQIEEIVNKYGFITHISVYMLEDYYYPDEWKGVSLRDDKYEIEYEEVRAYLESIGYSRYEISNYAKEGYECKHNKAYWKHLEYIGVGLSAHSYIGGYRIENHSNFGEYYKNIVKEKYSLTDEDKRIEKIMFDIRTIGVDMSMIAGDSLDELQVEGLISIEDKKIKLTSKGVVLSDYILKKIV